MKNFTFYKKIIFLLLIACTYHIPGFTQTEFGDWLKTDYSGTTNPTHRHENAFVEANGKFYLMGGRSPKPVDIYDPASNTWTQGAANYNAINIGQLHHFQGVAVGNNIYAICGFHADGTTEVPTTHVYYYNTTNNTWNTGAEIPVARRRGSAGAVAHNGKIYVIAGIQNGHMDGNVAWFDEFDPATGTWTTLTDAPRARDHFHATVINNKIYVSGGRRTSSANTFGETVGEVDVYDFSTNQWSTLNTSGTFTQRAGTATVSVGNEVIVLGGEGPNQTSAPSGGPWAHDQVEALNVETGTWRALPSMITGRHGTQALVYDQKIYISSGSSRRGGNGTTELEAHSMEVISFDNITGGGGDGGGSGTGGGTDGGGTGGGTGTGQGTTSLQKANVAGSLLKIYPNPVQDIINFEYKGGNGMKIEFYSPTGKTETILDVPGRTAKIDLSKYNPGIYWVKVIPADGKNYELYKVVKH